MVWRLTSYHVSIIATFTLTDRKVHSSEHLEDIGSDGITFPIITVADDSTNGDTIDVISRSPLLRKHRHVSHDYKGGVVLTAENHDNRVWNVFKHPNHRFITYYVVDIILTIVWHLSESVIMSNVSHPSMVIVVYVMDRIGITDYFCWTTEITVLFLNTGKKK